MSKCRKTTRYFSQLSAVSTSVQLKMCWIGQRQSLGCFLGEPPVLANKKRIQPSESCCKIPPNQQIEVYQENSNKYAFVYMHPSIYKHCITNMKKTIMQHFSLSYSSHRWMTVFCFNRKASSRSILLTASCFNAQKPSGIHLGLKRCKSIKIR